MPRVNPPSLAEIEITSSDIESIRVMQPETAAKLYDERVQFLDKAQKRTFVEFGLIMIEMEDRELYRLLLDSEGKAFPSLGRWISAAAPTSRSNAYAALNAMRAINEEVSSADLQEMPRVNINTVKKLSTSVRKDPKVIEAAKQMGEQEFKEHINKEHPEQHIEKDAPMRFKPAQGDRETIDEALAVSMWAYDLESREDAILAMALYFLQGKCEREGFQQVSNKDAHSKRSE